MSEQIFGDKPPVRKNEPGLATRVKVGQQLPDSSCGYYHERLFEKSLIKLAWLQSAKLSLRSPGICFANSRQQRDRIVGDQLVAKALGLETIWYSSGEENQKNSRYTGVSAHLRPAIHSCQWGQDFQTRIRIFVALTTSLIPNAAKETK